MNRVLLAHLLFLSVAAFGGDKTTVCELATRSIVDRSSSGLAQVSNLGDISIRCRVAAKPLPAAPGVHSTMLQPSTTAFQIAPDGRKKPIPSEVQVSGGGASADRRQVSLDFLVHILLPPDERDTEAERFLTKLEAAMNPNEVTPETHQQALERLRPLIYQHRVGHFRIECRILDGDKLVGADTLELEVIFKGRFSDVGLPGAPPV